MMISRILTPPQRTTATTLLFVLPTPGVQRARLAVCATASPRRNERRGITYIYAHTRTHTIARARVHVRVLRRTPCVLPPSLRRDAPRHMCHPRGLMYVPPFSLPFSPSLYLFLSLSIYLSARLVSVRHRSFRSLRFSRKGRTRDTRDVTCSFALLPCDFFSSAAVPLIVFS